jgi:hypothetical protein
MFGDYLLTAALLVGQPPAYLPAAPVTTYLPAAQTPAAPTDATTGNGTGAAETPKEQIQEEPETPEEKPKYFLEKVLQDTWLGQRGWKPYGWLEQSYTPSSASVRNTPVAVNDIANQYLLNQVWIGGAKEVDPTKKEFQLGGRVDFFYGSDARFTIPRGLFDYQLRSGTRNHYDIYQFYGEAFLPTVGPQGTTVRMGRFATHCSYEVVQAPDTPFMSRSYMFLNNPFTHTGVWAISPLNDTWTMSHGFATGSDTFIDPANRLTYLGQLKYAPKDGPTQVLFNTVITDPTYYAREAFPFYNVYNLQVIHKFSDKLTYVLDSGYSHVSDVPGLGFADWYGAVNYLFYNLSDKLTHQTRFELFNDTKGFRTGHSGLYTALTTGLAWKPTPWLMFRPGVRYDVNDRRRAFEGDYGLFTAFTDMIIRW